MPSIFDHLHHLNLSVQDKRGDIFDFSGKIEFHEIEYQLVAKATSQTFRIWKTIWKNAIEKKKNRNRRQGETIIIIGHLQLLAKHFEAAYFPQRLHQDLENEMWMINPLIADHLK